MGQAETAMEERSVSRFVCRFAVGRDGLAYSSVWRVWTARKKPDLYIAVHSLGGELKATVHAPHPPHTGWERHFGFDKNAASSVSQQAKRHGGHHKVRWTGCQLAPDTTVEYRVVVRGSSLEENGESVGTDVVLLPMPSKDEYVHVCVILGPTGPTPQDYPRERSGETYLLSEGRLSDDRRVWIVYVKKEYEKSTFAVDPIRIVPESAHVDPDADFKSARGLRGMTFGAQEDGSLLFLDMKATWIPTSTQ
jgi:hypothetical protein